MEEYERKCDEEKNQHEEKLQSTARDLKRCKEDTKCLDSMLQREEY